MAKKVSEREAVQEKLEKYISQQADIEVLINKYIEIYNKLDGAIEATRDILTQFEDKKQTTTTDTVE
jgi:hypothetical protein